MQHTSMTMMSKQSKEWEEKECGGKRKGVTMCERICVRNVAKRAIVSGEISIHSPPPLLPRVHGVMVSWCHGAHGAHGVTLCHGIPKLKKSLISRLRQGAYERSEIQLLFCLLTAPPLSLQHFVRPSSDRQCLSRIPSLSLRIPRRDWDVRIGEGKSERVRVSDEWTT